MPLRLITAAAILLLVSFSVCAADARVIQKDIGDDHTASWNQFADKVFQLHKHQLAGRAIRQTEEVGQYSGTAARGYAYTETSYYDAHSGLLLSRVRVDRDRPKILHFIEVYIYDDQGRVIRDFAAIYLPWVQSAPIRTMINLHAYNRDLHAYRQFDASGIRVYEQCKGKQNGARVDLSLDEEEIGPPVTASDAYQACFAGLQKTAGAYLSPH
jgi:hypothetical protein